MATTTTESGIPDLSDIIVKRWNDLDTTEVYAIARLRTEVLLREQRVDDAELDWRDRSSARRCGVTPVTPRATGADQIQYWHGNHHHRVRHPGPLGHHRQALE